MVSALSEKFQRLVSVAVANDVDPWSEAVFPISKLRMERVVAHRFDLMQIDQPGNWRDVPGFVKIDLEPFACGSMRQCYRLKKIRQVPDGQLEAPHWQSATNYVAKQFRNQDQDRGTYFRDVEMQMEAKLWATLYNRHRNPPKKIDMINTFLIEFLDRPGKPIFAVERFIEGDYRKHNSNCGFFDCEPDSRLTPQAFSHWTFEQSQGECMVVDIQGVGDLYTDPQVHTVSHRYTEGDLGMRGMAMFFCSHTCNPICELLHLKVIPMSADESSTREISLPDPNADCMTLRLAALHRELARLLLEGRFYDDHGVHRLRSPDLDGGYFHLCCSVSLGDPEAILALVRFCSNEIAVYGQSLLPEDLAVRLPTSCFAEDFIEALWDVSAKNLYISGLFHVAKRCISRNEIAKGIDFLRTSLKLTESDSPVPRYEILFLLGNCLAKGCPEIDPDLKSALELLTESSNIAIEQSDRFAAQKCFDLIAKLSV